MANQDQVPMVNVQIPRVNPQGGRNHQIHGVTQGQGNAYNPMADPESLFSTSK